VVKGENGTRSNNSIYTMAYMVLVMEEFNMDCID
jgi:hypothetical protein